MNQVTKVALISMIASLSLSAVAAPKTTVTVAPKVEVTAPPVKVEGLQTGTTMSLDAFKTTITPVSPVVNEGALQTLNQEDQAAAEQCGSSYVANKITARVPKLKGSEGQLAKAIDDGLLKSGCGDGGLLGVENDKVVENVAETVICEVNAGSSSDNVGGSCLLDAKKNDEDSTVATMSPEAAFDQAVEDFKAVKKCWFGGGSTAIN